MNARGRALSGHGPSYSKRAQHRATCDRTLAHDTPHGPKPTTHHAPSADSTARICRNADSTARMPKPSRTARNPSRMARKPSQSSNATAPQASCEHHLTQPTPPTTPHHPITVPFRSPFRSPFLCRPTLAYLALLTSSFTYTHEPQSHAHPC